MIDLLEKGCRQLGIDLNNAAAEKFIKYMNLLIEWNKKINLTAITEPEKIITLHFLDSLTVHSEIPQSAFVIDVGCGAGFPGLPLKIARPDIKLTLLDSLAKRLKFLETALKELDINDVTLVHSRAEEGGRDKNLREKYDVAVSRAVANLPVLCEYCMPFVKQGGVFAALKGPAAFAELETKAPEKLGGRVKEVISADVPFENLKHNIIIIEKLKPCPKEYPRKAGMPSKKPLE